MKGYRSARAGARRDSLALRCPVVTTQPDGPGSGSWRKLHTDEYIEAWRTGMSAPPQKAPLKWTLRRDVARSVAGEGEEG
jgi:hypothetical protein